MTMGPPQAEEALREALALGADRAIHLSDRVFARRRHDRHVADARARRSRKEGADLVLCGRKALDSETWQVPPQVAAFLGWPHVDQRRGDRALGGRLRAHARDRLRRGRVRGRAARSSSRWAGRRGSAARDRGRRDRASGRRPTSSTTSGRDDKRFGQTGSPTRVLAVRDVAPERAGVPRRERRGGGGPVRDLLAERAPERAELGEAGPHRARSPARATTAGASASSSTAGHRRVSLELIARQPRAGGQARRPGGRARSIGHELDERGAEAARHGAEVVYIVDDPALADYHPELWAAVLRQRAREHVPRVLLVPATGRGRDYGPRAAGDLELGMTARLRRRRHRQGGPPAPAEAGVRREHRLGHPGRDDPAARDGAARACTSRSSRGTSTREIHRLDLGASAGAEGQARRAGTGLRARTTWTRRTSSSASGRAVGPTVIRPRSRRPAPRSRGHPRSMRGGARPADAPGRPARAACRAARSTSAVGVGGRPRALGRRRQGPRRSSASATAVGPADVSVSRRPARASADPA